MRAVVLLAVCLTLGGAGLAVAPAASACTSDPAIVCGVIHVLDETGDCMETAKYTDPKNTVKSCLP